MKQLVFIIRNAYGSGGISRVTNMIINELIKTKKYLITVISLTKFSGEFCYSLNENVKILEMPFESFVLRKHTFAAAKYLKRLFDKNFKGTFVIDDVGYNIPAYLGLGHCKKAKFISWTHMNFFNGSKYGFSGIGKRLGVRKFDYVVALTKEDKRYYEKILKAKNIMQIYNPRSDEVLKNEYQKDSKKIISCGRLDKIKGFDYLIEVAKDVFSSIDDWSWDIYGDGPEKDVLQEKISEYGLTGKVILKGFRKDIYQIYQDYAFYVFTSRSEGCPMTMIEAQTAGLPMISFDFKCGPKDLITDGENGFIIHDWNLEDMASKIKMLIADEDLRVKFARNSDMNLKELQLQYVLSKWEEIL